MFTGGVDGTGADYNGIPLEVHPAVGYVDPAQGNFPSHDDVAYLIKYIL